jgi:hypothetical protein
LVEGGPMGFIEVTLLFNETDGSTESATLPSTGMAGSKETFLATSPLKEDTRLLTLGPPKFCRET